MISVVAVLCIPAFSFLQSATERASLNQEGALNDPPLGAPTGGGGAPAYSYPASDGQCKNGNWRTFVTPDGTFKNQGDCQSWVMTNGRNAPANTPVPTATALYSPPTATPAPATTPTGVIYTTPKNKGQCQGEKWRDFNPPSGPFKSEAECVTWVNEN